MIQIRENIIYINIKSLFIMSYCHFCNFSIQFVTFPKHEHWTRPRLARPRRPRPLLIVLKARPKPRTSIPGRRLLLLFGRGYSCARTIPSDSCAIASQTVACETATSLGSAWLRNHSLFLAQGGPLSAQPQGQASKKVSK